MEEENFENNQIMTKAERLDKFKKITQEFKFLENGIEVHFKIFQELTVRRIHLEELILSLKLDLMKEIIEDEEESKQAMM